MFWQLESLGVKNETENEKTERQVYQDNYEKSSQWFENNSIKRNPTFKQRTPNFALVWRNHSRRAQSWNNRKIR